MGAEVPDNPSTYFGDDATDTSETLTGKRERAPVAAATDSDIPAESADKEGRLGDLHPAFITDKAVARRYVQWWRLDMEGKIDTQNGTDPGASFGSDGGGQYSLRGLRASATVFWSRDWRRLKSVCVEGLRERRKWGKRRHESSSRFPR